jgi:hypothetical protein
MLPSVVQWTMAPKHHPTPLSGDARKALVKELRKARAMTVIFAERSAEKRALGEALIREADGLACKSWNERMWSDGGPIDPSPTIDQAVNGGFPWLEIACSRCKTRRDVDLASLAPCLHHAHPRSRQPPCLREVQACWETSASQAVAVGTASAA